jgi:hypothetical protein
MYTCIKHLDKYFLCTTPFSVVKFLNFSHRHICIQVLNIMTNIFYVWHRYFWFFVWSWMTPKKTNFWISSRDLWRHIFVTSFPHRIYDVIFLWCHFLTRFMTSYFCDVISSPDLWISSPELLYDFPHRIYDVISSPGLWISSPDLWCHFLTGFMNFLTGLMNFLTRLMTSV